MVNNAKKIYYEDIMNVLENSQELRSKLSNLVKEHKTIEILNLDSKCRHLIYKQMYYPLRFEKQMVTEENNENNEKMDNIIIRIWDFKIKNKETNNREMINNEYENIDNDETQDTEETQNTEDDETDIVDDISSSSEESYNTEVEEFEERTECMLGEIIEKNNIIIKNNNTTLFRINLVIYLNMVGWFMLFVIDPIRLVVTYKSNYEMCEI